MKLLGVVCGAVLIGIGLFVIWPWWQEIAMNTRMRRAVPINPITNEFFVSTSGDLVTNTPIQKIEKPKGVSPTDWALALGVRQSLLDFNQPVNFYARVVDQDGRPVQGSTLFMKFSFVDEQWVRSSEFFRGKPGEYLRQVPVELVSDTDGLFTLEGRRGLTLYFEDLAREGYYRDQTQNTSFTYRKDVHDRTAAFARREQRHTFHLWRKRTTERTIPLSIRVKMRESNGQWVSNYFVSFFGSKTTDVAGGDTDLVITGERHHTGRAELPYEFIFKMEVPNGGMIVCDDVYPFSPPTAGYSNIWSFAHVPKQGSAVDWTRTVYFKLRNGAAYAGTRMSLVSPFAFQIEGALNPVGSLLLEPDPEKQITDPEEIRRLDEATRP